jgi:hypothetical protein
MVALLGSTRFDQSIYERSFALSPYPFGAEIRNLRALAVGPLHVILDGRKASFLRLHSAGDDWLARTRSN